MFVQKIESGTHTIASKCERCCGENYEYQIQDVNDNYLPSTKSKIIFHITINENSVNATQSEERNDKNDGELSVAL